MRIIVDHNPMENKMYEFDTCCEMVADDNAYLDTLFDMFKKAVLLESYSEMGLYSTCKNYVREYEEIHALEDDIIRENKLKEEKLKVAKESDLAKESNLGKESSLNRENNLTNKNVDMNTDLNKQYLNLIKQFKQLGEIVNMLKDFREETDRGMN